MVKRQFQSPGIYRKFILNNNIEIFGDNEHMLKLNLVKDITLHAKEKGFEFCIQSGINGNRAVACQRDSMISTSNRKLRTSKSKVPGIKGSREEKGAIDRGEIIEN